MNTLLSKHRLKRANGDEGFTLIELLVVVVIIGVLIAVAIPLYLNYRRGAYDKSAESDLRNAVTLMEQCYADSGKYPDQNFTINNTNPSGLPGCNNGGRISVSDKTTLVYTTRGTDKYMLVSDNSGGNNWYCYNSENGGAVRTNGGLPDLNSAGC